ncbi:hypothetical protein BN12_380013 [Nostocoides japonicum T1-X7]|uniref:Uncharacterized protein n=1 Tax=Nostocoides japonicum T1-X7 TaxID=1194083 RepID=A0A077LZ59_9MICO|nr:hypothetical protein [Tetrasphaera japonica]CCH78931.1 hypothetical protein BN12_380013 [Tetrasphaera japonica T1-X7]
MPKPAWHGSNSRRRSTTRNRAPAAVEIEAEAPAGFDESTIRVVRENATTLRFDEAGFDELGS